MTPWAILAGGGLVSAAVGAVGYAVAGGVEARYLGNEKLGDAAGLLFAAGVFSFVLGVAGLFLAAAVSRGASKRTKKRRRHG